MEIHGKVQKTEAYINYIKRRKEFVAELKKERNPPEKLTFDEIEKMMKENQTL